ncbi:RNA polymerase I-specific transcription initiation factor rrn3 [Ophiocordyceps camponoti-floridani]|uniref:RNA polymerase I-specific transcription initiation factor rrn3 n=1 Tax=Ophiocordyceps camponoti-floridani TaxID=2030778 RepID=A0A8H4Q6U1_9HYPO|nr:RNA polymerase I-specific transcription initiation factor rrn3 [Ophiocordyceps camponoti-floridani]
MPSRRVLSRPPLKSATPVKSILKQPSSPSSMLGRRKEMHDGSSNADESVENPSKRRKVFFDEIRNVTYEVTGDWTLDDVKREVRFALEEHLIGNDGQYDILKELFTNSNKKHPAGEGKPKPHELQVYIKGLTSCIPVLKRRECSDLVGVILRCGWLGRDDGFVGAFAHFLAALVSAQGSYLVAVLSMLVEKFHFSRSSAWSVPDFPVVEREAMRERLHSTMQYLLQMFPAAVAVLGNLMSTKFPFADESVSMHMAYMRNLLQVVDYVPQLRIDILNMILNRVVAIDSQMQVDLEDVDDSVSTAVVCALQGVQRGAVDWEDCDWDDDGDNESVDSDIMDPNGEGFRVKTVKNKVETLDAMLDELFVLFSRHFAQPGSDQASDTFSMILREFVDIVLPTYRSRHTQFLVFHFAQQHPTLTDVFCDKLIEMAFRSNAAMVLRQSAASYLASFVARGARVPGSKVRSIFLLLLRNLEQYRRKYEPLCRGPDLARFHPYYSLAQATLYIFCFRWQDLVTSAPAMVDADDASSYLGHELGWVGGSKRELSTNMFCKLNPLKVCAPVIVDEFAKLAHRLKFLYVYPLVEQNKRIRLSQFISATYGRGSALRDTGRDDESFHQLDPFFPFDPYQLPVSKRWVEGDYVQWKRVRGLNAVDGDSDSDGEDEFDEDDEGEGRGGIEDATATESGGEESG